MAVLVVSVREGFLDQTERCVELLTEENIPFVVAVTKVSECVTE